MTRSILTWERTSLWWEYQSTGAGCSGGSWSPPSLETFPTHLDVSLCHPCPCVTCSGLSCLGRGVGQDDVQKSLPTLPIMGFFEKAIRCILKTSYFTIHFLKILTEWLIIEVLWRMCFVTQHHSNDVKKNDMVVTFASSFCTSVAVMRGTRKPLHSCHCPV